MITALEPVLKNRDALAQYFALSGFTWGAEIGVGDGVYARVLLEHNPGLRLLLVDPWDAAGGNRRGPESYTRTCVAMLPFLDRAVIHVATSAEAATAMPDRSLDFVFIDAAHDYASVLFDVTAWTPKVRPGGIVSGHDYYRIKNRPQKSGVEQAVDEYVAAQGFELQIIGWDRSHPLKDSRQPCWWFRV